MILAGRERGERLSAGDALSWGVMARSPLGSLRRLGATGVLAVFLLGAWHLPQQRTVVVRLEGNQFRPEQIRVRAGDTVRFVNGNGGPHNVMFVADSIAPAARSALETALKGDKLGPLSSPLLLDPEETYAFVVPRLPAGRYPLVCLPHQANMRGELIVVR